MNNTEASFIRGTTPEFVISLPDGVSFSNLGTVIVRLKQGSVINDMTPTIIDNKGHCKLTQEQTLKYKVGEVSLQLMAISGDKQNEVVPKSKIYKVKVLDSLWNEAVHNE